MECAQGFVNLWCERLDEIVGAFAVFREFEYADVRWLHVPYDCSKFGTCRDHDVAVLAFRHRHQSAFGPLRSPLRFLSGLPPGGRCG